MARCDSLEQLVVTKRGMGTWPAWSRLRGRSYCSFEFTRGIDPVLGVLAACAFIALGCADDVADPLRHSAARAPALNAGFVQHGNGWFYRGDSARITITAVAPSCNSPSVLMGYLWPLQFTLTYNACGELGRSWMKYPRISSDSSPLFITTRYVFGAYGTSNRMTGAYPKYVFYLKDDWQGNFGDLEVTVELFGCQKTGDPVLDAPGAAKVIDSLLALSNVKGPLESRRERTAVAWQNVVTNTVRFDISPREGDRCGTSIGVPPDTEQERVIGVMHTHPHYRGDDMTGCKAGAKRYRPEANGGGSNEDWVLARQFGVDVYAISPQVIHRLPQTTPERDRPKNRQRWKRVTAGCPKSY